MIAVLVFKALRAAQAAARARDSGTRAFISREGGGAHHTPYSSLPQRVKLSARSDKSQQGIRERNDPPSLMFACNLHPHNETEEGGRGWLWGLL